MHITHHKTSVSWAKKQYYLSHKTKESFFLNTLPSFVHSYKAYRQHDRKFLNDWCIQQKELIIDPNNENLQITWFGHASFLIRYGAINIITDPVFDSLPFFPRLTPFGYHLEHLPHIDVVLLSHNHHDHMDFNSLSHLAYRFKHATFCVASGDGNWLKKPLFKIVYEHNWGDFIVGKKKESEIVCTFLPSYHWSRRTLFDTNNSLWGSWLIKLNDYVIYFGGDSAYFDHFKEIGDRYKINVALLPIAPIEPRTWMKKSHMSPQEAGQAFFDLNADIFIPMHWGTFNFGIDKHHEPIAALEQWKLEHNEKLHNDNKQLTLLKIGESFIL